MFIAELSGEIRSLAAVILRRNISVTATDSQDINDSQNNVNLWKRLSEQGQTFVKTELLKTISEANDKITVHKICNLLIEVQGTLYDDNEYVW